MSKPIKMWMIFENYTNAPESGSISYTEVGAWNNYICMGDQSEVVKISLKGHYKAKQVTVTEGW
jgi:hypothetical protein